METKLNYTTTEKLVGMLKGEEIDKHEGCIVSRVALPSLLSLPSFRLRENLMLLCTQGELCIAVNGVRQMVLPQSLCVCPSGSVVQVDCTQAASFVCIIPTADYLSWNYNYWKQVLPLLMEVTKKYQHVMPLTDAEASELERMADCALDCLQRESPTDWMRESMSSSLRMLVCAILAKMKSMTTSQPKEQVMRRMDRSDEYFTRFMKLLAVHYREEREVAFYASKLCVTPKYFTAMVKKASGKTPAKWIEEAVMEEINYLLKNSTVSIKEIAYQLNFANLSFFGKYVKRHLGLSPHHYRTGSMMPNASISMSAV